MLEEYFFGHDRETTHDVRSAGKTFSSVMLGAAMMQGRRPVARDADLSLDAAPGAVRPSHPRQDEITLAHLLTHSAGLACNDNDEASPGNEDTMTGQTGPAELVEIHAGPGDGLRPGTPLRLLLGEHQPGRRRADGRDPNLATGIFRAHGRGAAAVRPVALEPMPTGEGYIGGGAQLRPRDLLKIGQAYLDGGAWNGRRIVTADWVRTSTAPRMAISPATTGYSEEEFGNYYGGGADAWPGT